MKTWMYIAAGILKYSPVLPCLMKESLKHVYIHTFKTAMICVLLDTWLTQLTMKSGV